MSQALLTEFPNRIKSKLSRHFLPYAYNFYTVPCEAWISPSPGFLKLWWWFGSTIIMVFVVSLFAFYFLPWTAEEPSENHSTNRLTLIFTVVLSGMAILACIIAFVIVRRKKKTHKLGNKLYFCMLNLKSFIYTHVTKVIYMSCYWVQIGITLKFRRAWMRVTDMWKVWLA